jgi:hypothetical protein
VAENGAELRNGWTSIIMIAQTCENQSQFEVADSTAMRKQKWLSINGCERKNPICATVQFLN